MNGQMERERVDGRGSVCACRCAEVGAWANEWADGWMEGWRGARVMDDRRWVVGQTHGWVGGWACGWKNWSKFRNENRGWGSSQESPR